MQPCSSGYHLRRSVSANIIMFFFILRKYLFKVVQYLNDLKIEDMNNRR